MAGRPRKKPEYNPELQFNHFLQELSDAYEEADSLRSLEDELNISLLKRKQVIIRTLIKKAVPLDGSKFYFFDLVFVFISSGRSSDHGSNLSSSSGFGNGPSWRRLSNTYVK